MSAFFYLPEALKLLAFEGAWHRPVSGAWFAVTANGDACDPWRPDAARWSIVGLVSRHGETDAGASGLLQRALPRGFSRLYEFELHPSTRQADVIALFERAISLASGGLL